MPDRTLTSPVNTVVIEGRITGIDRRTMPSGGEAVTFRVVVERPPRDRGPTGRVRVDTLDCVGWRADVRRRVEACDEGEHVRVEGTLRRRFWRAGAGPASRIEVEARRVTRVA